MNGSIRKKRSTRKHLILKLTSETWKIAWFSLIYVRPIRPWVQYFVKQEFTNRGRRVILNVCIFWFINDTTGSGPI